jgi:hypothetical protein
MTVITIDQLGLKTSSFLFTMWDEFVVTIITCCVEIEIGFVRKAEIKRLMGPVHEVVSGRNDSIILFLFWYLQDGRFRAIYLFSFCDFSQSC